MRKSYLDYAMSVIVSRALPDVRDGLKPVHRRILYTMYENGFTPDKPYKKSARIVGDVMGKYHPHGNLAIYDALVRMAQDFSLRLPLIDGQGNFGSMDGDPAAADRYTESRLAKSAMPLLDDLDKDTVDYTANYSNEFEEPSVLPAAFPNLLVNGAGGIAVGMATNMAPHNLGEVIDGIVHLLDNPEAAIKELMKFVKGPDFPTAGIICGREGFADAYNTGRGKVTIRARASIEQQKSNKEAIIITELPYQVNKANLILNMADLVQNKQIDGITDIRDESDKDGIRVVIELRRDVDANIVLNYLYKHTQMEITFGIINLALVNKSPKVLNLKQLMFHYITHRRVVIRRRTQFDLDKALRRAHILEGLKIAFKHLDEIIKTIRASKTTADAKEALIKKFELSEAQAQAILEMQLQRLAALERDKIEAEYQQLLKDIDNYRAILGSEKHVDAIIKEELAELKKKYADERRTEIAGRAEDIEIEDMIADEDMAITISNKGYVKRLSVDGYRSQKRGGKGVTAMTTSDEDFVERMFVASSKDFLLIFSNLGAVRWLKVYEIPVASRTAKGKAIVNLLSFKPEEKISAIVAVKEFREDQFLVFATKLGVVKKTKVSAYNNPRKGGIVGIGLENGDELIGVGLSNGKEDVLLATRQGLSLRFPEKQLRDIGRSAKGVRGINLEKGDFVVGMLVFAPDVDKTGAKLLSVCELGYAKRSDFADYRTQSRGGKGIINVKITDKNGAVVGVTTVSDGDEIMVVTKKGMVVRSSPSEIRETGRSAVGVRLISMEAGDKLSSIAHVVSHEEE